MIRVEKIFWPCSKIEFFYKEVNNVEYTLITPRKTDYTPIEQVLTNRGIEIDKIPEYINVSDAALYDPKLLDNIEQAATMVLKHFISQDEIFVQVDSDCDGYTSAAALINYLYSLFPSTVQNHVRYNLHTSKHHGIALEEIPANTKLVIVPDASSNEKEIHKQLVEQGIDVLVLDHHHTEDASDDLAIIVNNQLCDYPNKFLSGVGIVYKFCQIIDQYTHTSYADNQLDLVALGLIADMMDMRDLETRRLILKGLAQVKNPFFTYMIQKNSFSMKDTVNPFTVAFYIAPYVNSMTRVGTDEEKLLLFKSMLTYEAFQLVPSTKRGCGGQEELLVEQSVRTCANVKNRQERVKTAALDAINSQIERDNLLSDKILIIKLLNPVDTNLTGLLANQLMAKYQKPVLILNHREHIDEEAEVTYTWEGSGRAFNISAIQDWRKFISECPYSLYAEGHANAFGVGFTEDNVDLFINYMNTEFSDIEFNKYYAIDFLFEVTDDFDPIILELASYKEVWGQGVAEPLIAIKDIPITGGRLTLMSPDQHPTLKITIPNHDTTCIQFGCSLEQFNELTTLLDGLECIYLTVVGKCDKNEWRGDVTPQLKIEDYEVSKVDKWYF